MYLSISNSSFASHVFQRALCSASEPCHQIMIWMWVIVGWDSKIEGVAAYSWVQIGVGGRTETAERNAVSWPCEMESICKTNPRWCPASLNHPIATACEKTLRSLSQKTERKTTIFLLDLPPRLSATTSSVGQQGIRPGKDLPKVSSPSSMPPRLPRSTWNYLSLSFGTVSHLEGLFPWRCVFWHSKCSCDIDGGNKSYNTFLPCNALLCDGWIFCCFYPWVILGGFLCFPAIVWMRPNYDLLWSIDVAWMWSDFCCSAHRMKAHALFSTDLLLSWKQQGPD